MANDERLDIFDASMNWTGTASRAEAHAKGLWHQTFHCWVIRPHDQAVLLQLRQQDKDTFPGKLDVSAAGHLLAGETVQDGVRELEEELGIPVDFEELHYCGVVPQECVIHEHLIDREFNHVFIHTSSRPLSDYRFQREEVSGLYFIAQDDFKKLVEGTIEQVEVEGIYVDDAAGAERADRRVVRLEDITPNTEEYYALLFDQLQ
ncbi:NUDIX hydrolase [Paenibacillus daejeonensis]|uniref:NUDIX hydrolase n=1 Tax=Paenibacillus daejeonensis TaxID=135193 RepID=UPI00036B83BA|nr:NUDIX domain-containing protein [Paenibacillus daejeonensis]